MAALGIFMGISSNIVSVPDCWGEKFALLPFWQKIIFYYIAMSAKRCFYYAPFLIGTGAIQSCGLGYNGKDEVT
jgi:hypothetical protein